MSEFDPPIRNIYNWNKERMHKRVENYWQDYIDSGGATGDADDDLSPEELYAWHLETKIKSLTGGKKYGKKSK